MADTIIKGLEARGLTVEVTPPRPANPSSYYEREPQPSQTRVQIEGEWVAFGIDEDYDSIVIQQKPRKVRWSSLGDRLKTGQS